MVGKNTIILGEETWHKRWSNVFVYDVAYRHHHCQPEQKIIFKVLCSKKWSIIIWQENNIIVYLKTVFNWTSQISPGLNILRFFGNQIYFGNPFLNFSCVLTSGSQQSKSINPITLSVQRSLLYICVHVCYHFCTSFAPCDPEWEPRNITFLCLVTPV